MAERKKKDLPRGFSRRRLPRLGMEIPINLERILLGAARDEAFRERLLEDPVRAAAYGGFELKGSEKAMLAAMDRSTVAAMVQRFGPARSRKNKFATGVAAAVAGSMIISVATGCAESAGIDPAPPEDAQAEPDVEVDSTPDPVGGIFPDWPPDAPDLYEDPDVDDEDEGGVDADEDEADDAEEESDG